MVQSGWVCRVDCSAQRAQIMLLVTPFWLKRLGSSFRSVQLPGVPLFGAMEALRIAGKYCVGRKIESGSSSDIYSGTNVQTGEEVAIKSESIKAKQPQVTMLADEMINRTEYLGQPEMLGTRCQINMDNLRRSQWPRSQN